MRFLNAAGLIGLICLVIIGVFSGAILLGFALGIVR